jgi:hypothetical protein
MCVSLYSFEMTENVSEEGNVAFALEELAPGGQHVFNITVRPKLFGIYESTRARIKYNSGLPAIYDAEEDIRSGSSSSLGRTKIISAAEHLRNTSSYYKEWTFFVVAFSLAIIGPFWNWWTLKSTYKSSKSKSV